MRHSVKKVATMYQKIIGLRAEYRDQEGERVKPLGRLIDFMCFNSLGSIA
jgi:hypothetical protein